MAYLEDFEKDIKHIIYLFEQLLKNQTPNSMKTNNSQSKYPEILSIEQASKFYGRSLDSMYKMAQQGEIPCWLERGKWRFSKKALTEYAYSKSMECLNQVPQVENDDLVYGSKAYREKYGNEK